MRKCFSRYQANAGPRETLRLTRAFLKCGRPRDALDIASSGRRRYPEDRRIQKLYDAARSAQAHALLHQSVRALRAEASLDNYVRAADLCRTVGDFKKAFHYAEQAHTRFPQDWQVHFTLGKLHYYRSTVTGSFADRQAALQYLLHSRELNPEHYNTLILLAITFSRVGHFDYARSIVSEILERDPSDPRALQLWDYLEKLPAPAAATPEEEQQAEQEAEEGIEKTPGMREDDETSESLRELFDGLPGVLGLFLFDLDGNLMDSLTKPNETFDFGGHVEAVQSMTAACHFDSAKIGIGTLHSCCVSSDEWNVCVCPHESGDLVVFFDGSHSPEDVESQLRNMLEGALVG